MLALITATRDSIATLPETLSSIDGVRSQIKSFFVDGRSSDGTVEYVNSYIAAGANAVLLRQTASGLYDALNQGVQAAIDDTDVTHIGVLHSDDRLNPDEFQRYLLFIENSKAPMCYSDIEFHNSSGAIVRRWTSGAISKFKLSTGWMPPHTSIVVEKNVYRDLGLYNPDFGTAADYEWVVRILIDRGSEVRYFPERTLSMLIGGASNSSLKARLRANAMDGRVWADRSLLQSIIVRICKPTRKIGQFFGVKRET